MLGRISNLTPPDFRISFLMNTVDFFLFLLDTGINMINNNWLQEYAFRFISLTKLATFVQKIDTNILQKNPVTLKMNHKMEKWC